MRYLILTLLLLAGCTRNVMMTDIQTGEMLQAKANTVTREIEVIMPDGEILTGEYTVLRDASSVSFGSAVGYAPTGLTTLSGQSYSMSSNGSIYALLRGTKGTIMELKALFSGSNGAGSAVTNKKKEYRIQF